MCGADRVSGELGYCRAPAEMLVTLAYLHKWEEPPISGKSGSGTIFFSGCSLQCAYCQNSQISRGQKGDALSSKDVALEMLRLESLRAANINFVTPTHYSPGIREAIRIARNEGLSIPVVWNTSGYERAEVIEENAGLVEIYLTDFKYKDGKLAGELSGASDYFDVAISALRAMVGQVGSPRYADRGDALGKDADGKLLSSGVVVRHLMLPGMLQDSKDVLSALHAEFGNDVLYSIMGQYTPLVSDGKRADELHERLYRGHPEFARAVDRDEYEELLDFADGLGIEEYFWQEPGSVDESFIPDF